jgi:hypothetical protein
MESSDDQDINSARSDPTGNREHTENAGAPAGPDATSPGAAATAPALDQAVGRPSDPSDQGASASAQEPSGADPAAWYPVVGATDPVMSAVEPVPGAGAPVAADTPPAPSESAAEGPSEGPIWPEEHAAGAASAETPFADAAATSGAWPEPPTPWADTGAMAAVGAADASEAPQAEAPAPEAAAADVSDLPTAVNVPQAEAPQVEQTLDQGADQEASQTSPEAEPLLPPPVYAPPPQGYAAPSQPLYPRAGAYAASQPRPYNTTPVIVEAILAFFGVYGIGWLMAGETTIGVILLIAGFVWDAIFVFAAYTVIGLCCVVPLQLIFVALSAFQLNTRLRMRA